MEAITHTEKLKCLIPKEHLPAIKGGERAIEAISEDPEGLLWINLANYHTAHGTAAEIIRNDLTQMGVVCHISAEEAAAPLVQHFCINRDTFERAYKHNSGMCIYIQKQLLEVTGNDFALTNFNPIKYAADKIELKVPASDFTNAWNKLHQMLGLADIDKDKIDVSFPNAAITIFSIDAISLFRAIKIDPDKPLPDFH